MAHAETHDPNVYYVPHSSWWPIIGAIGLFVMMLGVASWMTGMGWGQGVFYVGLAVVLFMLTGWFRDVIRESVAGMYNKQVDVSFRMGMMWFIFSEIMFFAAFFGALFYARMLSVPWLGGEGHGAMTHALLWSEFDATWPTSGPAALGGAYETISAWGIPLLNTCILLLSGVTITIAHHALRAGERGRVLFWLAATVILGAIFMGFQIYEYIHAYVDLNLTLASGIYGATFFMLTGFHGLHVTLGAIMLAVIWFRVAKGHFTRDNHFGFEAVAWYWHFVDVVWLGLFVFVYVL
ncbi:cytochrome c oxidase subunit 3 [Alkalisalibacterium limincola]|uniref:cytochrome-c oxidase n=1 Tax=Alkalisalibacterium limincola TaxID=2699169 RepID=A0A5C8KTZ4_9GAMM|nr:cytochrome c oxidase subunit 3 [Alkalisalibacterium limincola]TXK64866.1 cytochrome c oxidase subunit 3 [Alkalisalibacterium limincola]